MGKWIEANEKLPDKDIFLAYCADGGMRIGRYNWLYRPPEGELRMPARYGDGVTITHWMPLPEPPGKV